MRDPRYSNSTGVCVSKEAFEKIYNQVEGPLNFPKTEPARTEESLLRADWEPDLPFGPIPTCHSPFQRGEYDLQSGTIARINSPFQQMNSRDARMDLSDANMRLETSSELNLSSASAVYDTSDSAARDTSAIAGRDSYIGQLNMSGGGSSVQLEGASAQSTQNQASCELSAEELSLINEMAEQCKRFVICKQNFVCVRYYMI